MAFLNYVVSFNKNTECFTYLLPNLDLEIYDAAGNKIGSSTTIYNNLEIVDFTATIAGNYTIKINRISPTGEKVYYGIAWT